ncbi:hypothetical protein V2J09_015289 [Rumex salicifolius]
MISHPIRPNSSNHGTPPPTAAPPGPASHAIPPPGRVVNISHSCLEDDGDSIIDTSMFGTLSLFIGNLTFLQLFDLSESKELKGPIPSELGQLNSPKFLSLGDNKLTGPIPNSFQRLSNLERLFFGNNRMTGPLSSSVFASFTKLIDLGLSGNKFSGPIPASIGKLTSLTQLALDSNRISGPIPPQIGTLKSLTSIDLS